MDNLLKAGLIVAVATMPGCSGDQAKIQTALDGMRDQVASEIEIHVEPASLSLHRPADRRHVVCGQAELNRASKDPDMRFDHEVQRFIVHVHDSGATITVFDGGRSASDKVEFQTQWTARCEN